jgi:hypothetical protein
MPIQYQIARSKLREHLTGAGTTDHMFYGPTSEQYWNESLKLVAVNMEPYGYEGTGHFEVTRDELINWIYDAGNTGTKTTRYTLAILATALLCFREKTPPSRDLLSAAFASDDKIEDALDRTVYYNIRAQSNTQKPQDYAAISAVGQSEGGRLVWHEIMALRPDVILVGGQAGLAAVNGLLGTQGNLSFRGSMNIGSVLIQSISHPSRPAYNDWCDAIKRIIEWMKKGA